MFCPLRFSSFTLEHVHIKEVEFAAYDQSQTWTEQLVAAERHVLNTRSKLIIQTKSNFSCQTQEDQKKKQSRLCECVKHYRPNINAKIIKETYTHVMSAGSQKYLQWS